MIPYDDGLSHTEVSKAKVLYDQAMDHWINLHLSRLALGLDLIRIEDTRAWKALGAESFTSFCQANPDNGGLGMKKRTRQQIMQVARVFILELEQNVDALKMIPNSNLVSGVVVANDKNIYQLITDMRILSNRDLCRNIEDGSYGDKPDEKLDATKEPESIQHHSVETECPCCGVLMGIDVTLNNKYTQIINLKMEKIK